MKFLFLSLLALASLTLSSGGRIPINSPWFLIKNITDKHITDLGEFAVMKHDEVAKDSLVFVEVLKGEKQVASGINYGLTFVAKNRDDKTENYEAEIWEKEWAKFRQLTSFKPV